MTGKRDRDPPTQRRRSSGRRPVPYLGKASLNDRVFHIVPLAAVLDPQVNLTISTTVAITVEFLGDIALYEEGTFSKDQLKPCGPARPVCWSPARCD